MLAMGRLITKELVVVLMLKILPEVPVETLEIILLTTRLLLEERFLLASVTTREFAVRVAKLKLPKESTKSRVVPEEEDMEKGLIESEEVTVNLLLGVVVPMPTLPAALILNFSEPAVEKPKSSAPVKNMPLLLLPAPVKLYPGVAAEPVVARKVPPLSPELFIEKFWLPPTVKPIVLVVDRKIPVPKLVPKE